MTAWITEHVNTEDDAINLQSDLDALQKWENDKGVSFKPT